MSFAFSFVTNSPVQGCDSRFARQLELQQQLPLTDGLHDSRRVDGGRLGGERSRPWRDSGSHGFTLIELLVVISIISLLIALLLPVLSQARESARKIICSNNMRSCGMGFVYYAETYKDYFPTAGAQAKAWQKMLGNGGFIGGSKPLTMTSVSSPYTATVQSFSWPALECPAEKGAPRINGATFYRYQGTGTSFNASWYLSRYGYGQTRPGWSRGPAAKAYRGKISSTGILMDMTDRGGGWTMNYYLNDADYDSGTNYTNSLYAFRHLGSTNRLFMDTHVASAKHKIETGVALVQALYLEDAPSPN